MAKKKEVVDEGKEKKQERKSSIDDVILKEFGNVIKSADYVKTRRKITIPVTPKLNMIMGGGIPEGTLTIITGPPKAGKSTLSLQIAANAQKLPGTHGPRCVYYYDIEGRIKYRDIAGIKGLDLSPDRFKLIQSEPGNILTGDKFMDIGEKLINAMPGCVFIFDSFSAICTQSRQEADIKDRFRDDAPLILAAFCKKLSQVIPINDSIVIGITHLIANQGGGHIPWMEASGRKIQYQCDNKLHITHFKLWEAGEEKVGQQVFFKVGTSALAGPGGETDCWLRFGEGYDDYMEIFKLALDLGMVTKKGSWYQFDGQQFQGEEKFRNFLATDDAAFNKLKTNLDALYKVKNET